MTRPKGTKQELEARRKKAIRLLEQGNSVTEVADRLGVYQGSVSKWKKAYEEEGIEGIQSKPHPGRKPKVTEDQYPRLKEILKEGPEAYGFSTDLWTLDRVGQVLAEEFDVSLDPSNVWRLLDRMGWSCQKPESQARERDEEAIKDWREETWPEIKKKQE